jgi:iron complex outermembrane receptor protein
MGMTLEPRLRVRLLGSILGFGALAPVSIAQGQTPGQNGTAASDEELVEIIVTARKVEENLQTVPIAITSLSTDNLAQMNLTQTTDLAQFLPSTFIEAPGGNNVTAAKVTIRGQVQTDTLITLDPSIGWYLDDVYLARAYGTNLSLFDVQRVETLEGPQGTLYGRNTTGGAIKIYSVKADPNAGVDGFATVGWGKYNDQTAGGAINLPLVDGVFALRLAAQIDDQHNGDATLVRSDRPPFSAYSPGGSNAGPGQVGTHDNWLGRINGTWLVNDKTNIWFGFEHDKEDVNYLEYNLLGDEFVGFAGLPGSVTSPSGYTRSSTNFFNATLSGGVPRSTAYANTGNLTAQYAIQQNITTRLILGFRELTSTFNSDIDGTDLPLDEFLAPIQQDDRQWSAEWQLAWNKIADSPFDFLGGLYYFQEKGTDNQIPDGLAEAGPLFQPYAVPLIATVDSNRSRSGFVSGTYHVTDAIDVNAGLRYTWDTKPLTTSTFQEALPTGTFVDCLLSPASPGYNAANCSASRSDSFRFPSWNAAIDWKLTPGAMLYLKGSSAERAGGQNERGLDPATEAPFQPEKATDLEVGIKTELLDHRVRLNADYYHTFYSNVQQTELLATPSGLITDVYNAGKANINGVEGELTAKLTNNLTFIENASYFNGVFTDHDVTVEASVGTPTFNSAPRWQSGSELLYQQSAPGGIFSASVNFSYRTYYYANGFTREEIVALPKEDTTVAGLGLLSARLAFKIAATNTEVALWGKNLTNKTYYESPLSLVGAGLPVVNVMPQEPLTTGVTITQRF